MYLPSDAKTKTNLSVITLTTTVMATPLMSIIGLVVAKRGNSHLVLERKWKQKKALPILTKMDLEKYYSQI